MSNLLPRRRLAAGSYELFDADERAVVRIDKTGTTGRDD